MEDKLPFRLREKETLIASAKKCQLKSEKLNARIEKNSFGAKEDDSFISKLPNIILCGGYLTNKRLVICKEDYFNPNGLIGKMINIFSKDAILGSVLYDINLANIEKVLPVKTFVPSIQVELLNGDMTVESIKLQFSGKFGKRGTERDEFINKLEVEVNVVQKEDENSKSDQLSPKLNSLGINDLEKLSELEKKGLISKEEYELKKKQILGL